MHPPRAVKNQEPVPRWRIAFAMLVPLETAKRSALERRRLAAAWRRVRRRNFPIPPHGMPVPPVFIRAIA